MFHENAVLHDGRAEYRGLTEFKRFYVLASATSLTLQETPHDLTNGQAHSRFGIFGIDSIPNFNLHFFAEGFDSNGNPNEEWYTNTIGNPPETGGTTVINAPLQPVNVESDDANGNPRSIGGQPLTSLATPFVGLVLASPVFSNALYSSGDTPTQFSDAIQRAQFFNLSTQRPQKRKMYGKILVPVHFCSRETYTGNEATRDHDCAVGGTYAGMDSQDSASDDDWHGERLKGRTQVVGTWCGRVSRRLLGPGAIFRGLPERLGDLDAAPEIRPASLWPSPGGQCARVGESQPAARGTEIHQIPAAYINHLVRTRRATDLEVFDALMKGAGAEAGQRICQRDEL